MNLSVLILCACMSVQYDDNNNPLKLNMM